MIVHTMPQRSPEWFAARLGRLTGSCAREMLATVKSGEAAARRDLRTRLALERVTGRPESDGYVNADMQRGIDLEPVARARFESVCGVLIDETGFCAHETLWAGCSLDGHLGRFQTLVSLKCPKSATHLRYLRDRVIPADYVPQMLHECWITGAREYLFASFDDRFPSALQLVIVSRAVAEAEVSAYAAKAEAFLAEVDAEVDAILALMVSAADDL